MAAPTLAQKMRQYCTERRKYLDSQLEALNARLASGQIVRGDWESLRTREIVVRELEELTEYLGA